MCITGLLEKPRIFTRSDPDNYRDGTEELAEINFRFVPLYFRFFPERKYLNI